jgi:hypothetical protein
MSETRVYKRPLYLIVSLEVKSGRARSDYSGMDAFEKYFQPFRKLLVRRSGNSAGGIFGNADFELGGGKKVLGSFNPSPKLPGSLMSFKRRIMRAIKDAEVYILRIGMGGPFGFSGCFDARLARVLRAQIPARRGVPWAVLPEDSPDLASVPEIRCPQSIPNKYLGTT